MTFFDQAMANVHAACDELFAHAAVFEPAAGGAYACRAELTQPEPEFAQGEAKVIIPDALLRVLKSALPFQPRRRDVFALTLPNDQVARYRVLSAPVTEDDDGMRWTIKVEKLS